MKSREQRILELLTEIDGQTDRQLTDKIYGKETHPSSINAECNHLAQIEKITRKKVAGVYRNFLKESLVQNSEKIEIPKTVYQPLSEDYLKAILHDLLVHQGWDVNVAWGKTKGIDIDAHRGNERWIIEVKGSGSLQPMRVNYFIGVLGELLQRMDDPNARYSIALPDMKQYRGLWERLPKLAKNRTSISILFVKEDGTIEEVF
ncbi:MarR family transcriptional regulator [Paenibacillus sp. RC21]|uniref:MarR family transcriptional regulator n=1 Tax=Paenibacillus sp. RC21 TaxID=3156312 RepID=UPI00383899FF